MLLALRQVSVILILFTVILGGVYPAIVTGLSKWWFPKQADGSIIKDEKGNAIGSELIGQNFTSPEYFWGRPSATAPMPYNAAASTGSNLSNSAPALLDAIKARVDTLKQANPKNRDPIPVDLVTASASGLDPHISIAAAYYQIGRVAKARGLSEDKVKELIDKYTEDRIMGIIGEPVVNVLLLNLELDKQS
jgi:K+-transporting ATPase ATPase C chain